MVIERPEKFGGNLEYSSYDALEADFIAGQLHPMDLKKAVATYINELIQPVREHFKTDKKAKKLAGFIKSLQKK